MQKNIRVMVILLLVLCLLSGCSVPFLDLSQTVLGTGDAVSGTDATEGTQNDGAVYITGEEDARIKTLISDYFSSLYSEPVQNYYSYAVKGKVPDKIKDFISKDTINMAEGNMEIGIHLPRFIETNGLVCIGYELAMNKASNGTGTPDIKADFAGGYGSGLLYYTKVNLYARCVSASDFEKLYTLNQVDNTWTKVDGNQIDEKLTDMIKLQARYDVQVKKEEGNYKLEAVKEAITTNGVKSRLLLYNNDFIGRLSYLDYVKSDDGKSYIKEEDGRIYDEEKAVITAFFSSLKNSLNIENMKLMQTVWNKNVTDFNAFLGKISLAGDGDTKKFSDLIDMKADYKTKFDYYSLPLQLNMERLDGEFSEMEIIPHPGYTKKHKIYAVTFKVPVIKLNGSVQGDEYIYRYDYFITLSRINETLKIDGMKLNEFSRVNAEKT